ncbi:hypothetical protein PRIPAC_79352 [Pristionchus pacificus]|uniref:Uncharacterized protein n=1 Tax=Pristionchus pacificus TaxID=54126 RepID=A0A2A6BYF5_PRIPA|nr:hypothetical protein PRIPAC_79352 [Pristionchus pacificus]|eukprot:PDM71042.1 hypothetical protein PRIPAC_44438 [Pristionchus pacificus]
MATRVPPPELDGDNAFAKDSFDLLIGCINYVTRLNILLSCLSCLDPEPPPIPPSRPSSTPSSFTCHMTLNFEMITSSDAKMNDAHSLLSMMTRCPDVPTLFSLTLITTSFSSGSAMSIVCHRISLIYCPIHIQSLILMNSYSTFLI